MGQAKVKQPINYIAVWCYTLITNFLCTDYIYAIWLAILCRYIPKASGLINTEARILSRKWFNIHKQVTTNKLILLDYSRHIVNFFVININDHAIRRIPLLNIKMYKWFLKFYYFLYQVLVLEKSMKVWTLEQGRPWKWKI